MTTKRRYALRKRAERQEETRRRITEATVALHEEVGPARTTISAIAERAGVERLTVYRHFPDDRALLRACQQHFLTTHPPPNPGTWAGITDPPERLRFALAALYAHYERTEAMTANLLRDVATMPVLAELLAGLPDYFAAVRDGLGHDWPVDTHRRPLVLAAIGHALDFETWRSLVRRQELSVAEAIALMARLVEYAAAREAGTLDDDLESMP